MKKLIVAASLVLGLLAPIAPAADAGVPGLPFTETGCDEYSDAVARLYTAAFGRVPEAGGFSYWMDEYTSGRWGLPRMAAFFADSPEFKELNGALYNAGFITQLYRNVLLREPDQDGLTYWLTQMQSGMTRGTLLLRFSESPENVQTSGTTPPALGDFNVGISGPWACSPSNIAEYETQWALARTRVVNEIIANGYGINANNVLVGPSGFQINLNNCPGDWSNTEGLSGNTILIGQTIARSGNLAAYGQVADGMVGYFDYVNETGGIAGRNVRMLVKDDAYIATRTIEMVDNLLNIDKPFLINTLGSPGSLAVYDTLNSECVPHPFVISGHPAWGDPQGHPWTNGSQMAYNTEAHLWGTWIRENMAGQLPVKVAGLVMDNDFGLAYEEGMADFADANPDVVSEFIAVRHDPAAPTVTNEMRTIASEDPDVFISMTAGNPCLLATEAAGREGLTTNGTVLFAPSVCRHPEAYMIPAGAYANGWISVTGGVKSTTDAAYANDPYVAFVNSQLAGRGLSGTGLHGVGFGAIGWPMVEALRIAAELPGGLTRTNFALAIRSMDLDNPNYVDGVSFAYDGGADGYAVEGSDFAVFNSQSQSWVLIPESVIDINGETPNCSFNFSGC